MPEEHTPETDEHLESAFSEAAAAAAAESQPASETPPPEASPSPQAGSAEPPPEEPALSPAFQAAQEAGLDVSEYADDAALIQGLFKQYEEAQPYVNYARQVLPYDEQIRQTIQQQQAPQQPQPEEGKPEEQEWSVTDHFQKQWQPAEYDEHWEAFVTSGMVTVDPQTGHYIPSEGYAASVPPQVLHGLNNHRTWQREALEKLVTNPYESTWDAFQEPLQKMIQDQIQTHLGQYSTNQQITSWEEQNAQLLYEHDAQGRLINDIYGNPKTTEYGDAFIRSAQELRASGIEDDQKILELAFKMTQGLLPQQEAPSEQTAQEPEEKAPETFLGSAMEKAAHNPSAGNYAEGEGTDPVAQNSRELENMFVSSAKKQKLF